MAHEHVKSRAAKTARLPEWVKIHNLITASCTRRENWARNRRENLLFVPFHSPFEVKNYSAGVMAKGLYTSQLVPYCENVFYWQKI